LLANDWIRAGAIDAEVFDEHLWWWMRIHWGIYRAYAFQPWLEAAYLIQESPLPESAKWLRQSLIDDPVFLLDMTAGISRDPYSVSLQAISNYQIDDSLLDFWYETCKLRQSPPHVWRGIQGVRGLEKIPCISDDAIAEGFKLWKESIESLLEKDKRGREACLITLASHIRMMSSVYRRPSLKNNSKIQEITSQLAPLSK
jgi:hypothetical protein